MIHGAQEFCRQPRRDEGAYPQRSVTEEQRWMAVKEQADCVMFFLDVSLERGCLQPHPHREVQRSYGDTISNLPEPSVPDTNPPACSFCVPLVVKAGESMMP